MIINILFQTPSFPTNMTYRENFWGETSSRPNNSMQGTRNFMTDTRNIQDINSESLEILGSQYEY